MLGGCIAARGSGGNKSRKYMTYPDGHADAAWHGQARSGDPGVAVGLVLELLGGGGGVHADVDLGVGDVDAEVGHGAQAALEDLLGRGGDVLGAGLLGDQVALEADAVDLDAPRLDQLDDAHGAQGLGRGGAVLEVVVVVVQLGSRVGGSGDAEGDGEVRLADYAEEDVVTVGAVLVERCWLETC